MAPRPRVYYISMYYVVLNERKLDTGQAAQWALVLLGLVTAMNLEAPRVELQ